MQSQKWLYQEAHEHADEIKPTMSLDDLYLRSIWSTGFSNPFEQPEGAEDRKVESVLALQEPFEKLANGQIPVEDQPGLIGYALLVTAKAFYSRYSLTLDFKEALWCKQYVNMLKYLPLQGILHIRAKGELDQLNSEEEFNIYKEESKGIAERNGYTNHRLAYTYLKGIDGIRHYKDGLSVEEFEFAIKYWLKYLYKDFSHSELTSYLVDELSELRNAWGNIRGHYSQDPAVAGRDMIDDKLDYSLELADVYNYIVSIAVALGINTADAVRSVSRTEFGRKIGVNRVRTAINTWSEYTNRISLLKVDPNRWKVRKKESSLKRPLLIVD